MLLRVRYILTLLSVIFPVLVACDSSADEADAPTPTQPIPTPADTPEPATPAVSSEPSVVPVNSTAPLIMWTIPDISPEPAAAGGESLAQQIETFDANHPELNPQVELKTATGQGGILSYLQSGRTVAPSILPDLVLLPAEQLREAATAELVHPLEDLLPAEALDDLFPVSAGLGTVNNTLYGYPYALTGLTHLAYNTNEITETLPVVWPLLAETPANFAFPASGPSGTRLLLQFYLAEGGTLMDDAGQPLLEEEALTRALRHFERGRQNGFVAAQTFTFSNLEDSWRAYQNGEVNVVQITAGQFLTQHTPGSADGFAPLPGPDGPLAPHVSGWVWAISTPDPARQALAAELLAWLVNGPNMGTWSVQSQRLPTRRAAFERWPSDPYVTFLQLELERATPYPTEAVGPINEALSQAITAIVSPASEPADVLAQRAVEALQQ